MIKKQALTIDLTRGKSQINILVDALRNLKRMTATHARLILALGMEELSEEVAYKIQQVLAGDIGNSRFSHFYWHDELDRMVPRFVGGKHMQIGALHDSITWEKVNDMEYEIGAARSEAPYADDVAMLDSFEIGETYAEKGLSFINNQTVFEIFSGVL